MREKQAEFGKARAGGRGLLQEFQNVRIFHSPVSVCAHPYGEPFAENEMPQIGAAPVGMPDGFVLTAGRPHMPVYAQRAVRYKLRAVEPYGARAIQQHGIVCKRAKLD